MMKLKNTRKLEINKLRNILHIVLAFISFHIIYTQDIY